LKVTIRIVLRQQSSEIQTDATPAGEHLRHHETPRVIGITVNAVGVGGKSEDILMSVELKRESGKILEITAASTIFADYYHTRFTAG